MSKGEVQAAVGADEAARHRRAAGMSKPHPSVPHMDRNPPHLVGTPADHPCRILDLPGKYQSRGIEVTEEYACTLPTIPKQQKD